MATGQACSHGQGPMLAGLPMITGSSCTVSIKGVGVKGWGGEDGGGRGTQLLRRCRGFSEIQPWGSLFAHDDLLVTRIPTVWAVRFRAQG